MGELTTTLPADLDLGPTVYGHRRKGNCSEIETVVMPGPDTRAAASKSRSGPSHRRDDLAGGNVNSRYITYTHAEQGTPLTLAVPEEPGEY